MNSLTRLIASTLVATLALSGGLNAWAHSFPESETPAAGQTLTSPPSEVTIKYDAPIEQLFARIEVVGPDGQNLALGDPVVGEDGYTLTVRVPPLKPGGYMVKWGVVCVDTHHTQGSYPFTVAGAGQ